MKNTDEIYETYKDWDMSNGVRGVDNPMMKKFQQAKANYEQNQSLPFASLPFDSDVVELIKQHSSNQKDVERMNTVLRALFA